MVVSNFTDKQMGYWAILMRFKYFANSLVSLIIMILDKTFVMKVAEMLLDISSIMEMVKDFFIMIMVMILIKYHFTSKVKGFNLFIILE